ncbi:MAG: serine protease family protein [Planctomycetota bacterium]|jgi:hypothetical protein
MLSWADALEKIKPYIFRISTPNGHGSGFQVHCSDNWCGVATALHVIKHALDWDEPIKVYHYASKETTWVRLSMVPDHCYFCRHDERDLAIILFKKNELTVESGFLDLIPPKQRIKQGIHIGWCGFPALAPDELCFFAGHISSYLEKEESYLVDGVAINGVSGGPAFYLLVSEDNPLVCGIVSAYIPNIATGKLLPGVCVIRSAQAFRHALQQLDKIIPQKPSE